MKKSSSRVINFRLSVRLLKAIRKQAAHQGLTVSQYVRDVLAAAAAT